MDKLEKQLNFKKERVLDFFDAKNAGYVVGSAETDIEVSENNHLEENWMSLTRKLKPFLMPK